MTTATENLPIKERVLDFVGYYAIEGSYNTSMHFKDVKQVKGIALTLNAPSRYDHSIMYAALLNEDGTIKIGGYCNLTSKRMATDKEIAKFNKALGNIGLTIGDITKEERTKPFLQDPYILRETKKAILFKNPEKVKFYMGGTFYTRKQFEKAEIPQGRMIQYLYDNGYSHMSSTPTSKEEYLKRVDAFLQRPFNSPNDCIDLSRDDNGKYYIYVRLGGTERWSETSNS